MFSTFYKHFYKKNDMFKRFKHRPDHWSVVRKKIHPVDKALSHFDEFYKEIFKSKWPSIREGLLSKQKYVAVVNNFGDNEETMTNFEHQGALNIRRLFKVEKEFFQDNYHKRAKQKLLQKVFEIDEQIEKEQVDLVASQKENKTPDLSLEKSLENAELDTRRLIDTKNNALSGEMLQEFVPATQIKGMEDFVPESSHYQYYNVSKNFDVKIEKEFDFHFPDHLNVYCFEEENDSDFDPSPRASTGVLNYYLMDGGSILPILALDLRPRDRFLDMCAAPGGKSLLALQTLYPDLVVSNDVSLKRVNRIYKVYRQFLYDLEERWIKPGKLKITNMDGRIITDDLYDKILVDVPCTTDRHSVIENENNIFNPSRIKERLKIPELQCQLLVNALKLIKVDGIVVYSTCSLSPIQNDGVVNMALKQIWEETKIEIIVKDLSPALLQTHQVHKLASRKLLKFGHLVIPDRAQNFGPTYFCKLQRVK